jgi:hypothetical protein
MVFKIFSCFQLIININRNAVLQWKWMDIATFLRIIAGQFYSALSPIGWQSHFRDFSAHPAIRKICLLGISLFLSISQRLSTTLKN